MMRRRRAAGTGVGNSATSHVRWFVFALFALLTFWAACFVVLATNWHYGQLVSQGTQLRVKDDGKQMWLDSPSIAIDKSVHEFKLNPINLSRTGKVIATADIRGNLGPASVVVQPHPGKDWIHDRWQAASDMHGTAIKGVHWILLDFGTEVVPDKIILDWEAAYSDEYRLEASLTPITEASTKDEIWVVYDTTNSVQKAQIIIEKIGQSPGVKTNNPLHVLHKLQPQNSKPFRYLRLYILGSATGWGVSLWQFDVIGYEKDKVIA